jgi:lactate dehydrogenase-like 2-hydroxyacid dehydrogenase
MDVVVLGALPPELQAALSARHRLIQDAPDLADAARFQVAVTTSVAGANAATFARLSGLRLLACNGVGLDRIDMKAAAAQGIAVRHTPDAVRADTADSAVALVLATVRRVAEADRFVRAGRWSHGRMTPARRVTGMRAGIVGLGAIGTMIAGKLSGLGLAVSYTGPREKPAPYRFFATIGELAGNSDVLILSCPGGEATRHLVTAGVLRRLGPAGYLVNVSRGTVVDEGALLDALEARSICGAGLDVFAAEPGLDPRFLPLENVVLQPHYAAVTQEARAEMAATILAAIEAFSREAAGLTAPTDLKLVTEGEPHQVTGDDIL